MAQYNIKKNKKQDKITKKVLNIFKSAETENEKLCYLEAIKNAQKCFKLVTENKSSMLQFIYRKI